MVTNFADWNLGLAHHGIKGQKWGVRRFQNLDGTKTELGKQRDVAIGRVRKAAKTKADVDKIFNTLSKTEKKFLAGAGQEKSKEWLSLNEGENVVKRFLKKDGNKPVAFLDIIEGGSKYTGKQYEIGIATRSGRKYRGKGYGSELVKKAVDWIDKHPDLMDKDVFWMANPKNTASNNMAKKFGFAYDEEKSSNHYDNYYTVKKKKAK